MKAKINLKGFSLIELMVVVAVVAILSAVALPAYKNYQIKSRIASFYPTINQLIEKAKVVMQTTGRDVTYTDVGLTNTYTGPHGLGGAYPPSPGYVEAINIFPFYSCNKPGKTTMYVVWYDLYKLGISSTPNTFGRLVYFIYGIDGTFYTKCNNFDLYPGFEIPGCTDPWQNLAAGQPSC